MATRRVLLKGLYGLRDEAEATEAITPGHLVEEHAAGSVRKHATAGGNAIPVFALEREMTGDDKDTAYANGDTCLLYFARTGDVIHAVVAAGAAAIAYNAPVQSAGNGTVAVHTPPSDAAGTTIKHDQIVGYALEAVDNSGGGSAVRIKIRVR